MGCITKPTLEADKVLASADTGKPVVIHEINRDVLSNRYVRGLLGQVCNRKTARYDDA